MQRAHSLLNNQPAIFCHLSDPPHMLYIIGHRIGHPDFRPEGRRPVGHAAFSIERVPGAPRGRRASRTGWVSMAEFSRDIEVLRFDRLPAANRALARRLAGTAAEAVRRRGRFVLALSGGSTPLGLYGLLAGEFKDRIPWGQTHLFWGDERCVGRMDPSSNYHMAHEALISKIPVPAPNVHPPPVEISPPAKAALAYERTLRVFFEPPETPIAEETFDAILLGVGPDGHTASLYPGSPVLGDHDRWVRSVLAPLPFSPRRRITLTLPAINASRFALFLVSGREKTAVVDAILGLPAEARRRYPAARIRPRIHAAWFIARES
jgi:6-phosphogluconolactonase